MSFDVILTSETIYNIEGQQSLYKLGVDYYSWDSKVINTIVIPTFSS